MKETLKSMKEMLISQTSAQVANLKEADCKELGEAIDMIKDLEEAVYYCTIIEAMEHKDEEKQVANNYYYTESKYIPMYDDSIYYRDMDRPYGRMYYSGGGNGSSNGGNSGSSMGGNGSGASYYGGRNSADHMESSSSAWGNEGRDGRVNQYGGSYMPPYYEREYPIELRDSREGRSPLSRKQYMESKELHQDKAKQLRDLEKYMQELTSDIAEMIEDATPEEKQLLQKKISSLATKIDQLK